jgi:ferredoxin
MIKGRQLALSRKAATLDSLAEGLRFMQRTKVILAAITLDMFAVLFGGAVALLPVYANNDVAMGKAVVDEARCLTWGGQACTVCKEHCPMEGALAFDPGGKLRVADDKCTGCGLCEHYCPTEPQSIRIVPRA